MIKYCCDRCRAESFDKMQSFSYEEYAKDANGAILMSFPRFVNLCDDCHAKYQQLPDVDIDEFIGMTNNDIELRLYKFNVGDIVITSTGGIGKIVDVCECDKCEERGFYELLARMNNGSYNLYITNADKENGFKHFYRIGNYIFGNFDKDRVQKNINGVKQKINSVKQRIAGVSQEADELQKALAMYTQQMNTLCSLNKIVHEDDEELDWLDTV